MEKDFDKWNEVKKEIEEDNRNIIIKEREIWWTNMGLNIWTESCGKWDFFRRPVLV